MTPAPWHSAQALREHRPSLRRTGITRSPTSSTDTSSPADTSSPTIIPARGSSTYSVNSRFNERAPYRDRKPSPARSSRASSESVSTYPMAAARSAIRANSMSTMRFASSDDSSSNTTMSSMRLRNSGAKVSSSASR